MELEKYKRALKEKEDKIEIRMMLQKEAEEKEASLRKQMQGMPKLFNFKVVLIDIYGSRTPAHLRLPQPGWRLDLFSVF